MYRESPIIRWRRNPEKYRFEGNKCSQCNKIYYPKKHLCKCGSKEFVDYKLNGKGRILTFTEIKSSPDTFSDMTPYCVGVIELEDGPKITSQITDCNVTELKVGMKVESVFRKFFASGESGIIHYGLKFKPIS